MKSYTFTMSGISPLLMHADSIEGSDKVSKWRKDPANKNLTVPGDDRSPAWSWMTYVYTDLEKVCIPSEVVMACLRMASAKLILKRNTTFKEISQSGMMIIDEFCDFTTNGKHIEFQQLKNIEELTYDDQCESVKSLGFELWAKRARIGTSKHVRVRPRFKDWKVTGTICVTAAEITQDILSRMFKLAGDVGIGDWRPSCKTPGPYGRFIAALD